MKESCDTYGSANRDREVPDKSKGAYPKVPGSWHNNNNGNKGHRRGEAEPESASSRPKASIGRAYVDRDFSIDEMQKLCGSVDWAQVNRLCRNKFSEKPGKSAPEKVDVIDNLDSGEEEDNEEREESGNQNNDWFREGDDRQVR